MKPASCAELARLCDHSLVRPDATARDVEKICAEAREHSFRGVCVYSSRVELAYSLLEETDLKVTALISFPLGTADADAKRYEAEVALDHGAHEIEAVINLGRLRDGDNRYILRELRDLVEGAEERPVRAVFETALMSKELIQLACQMAAEAGVDALCTGTGLGVGITPEVLKEIRSWLNPKLGLKTSGPIPDAATALALIDAGATQLAPRDGLSLLRSWPATPTLAEPKA